MTTTTKPTNDEINEHIRLKLERVVVKTHKGYVDGDISVEEAKIRLGVISELVESGIILVEKTEGWMKYLLGLISTVIDATEESVAEESRMTRLMSLVAFHEAVRDCKKEIENEDEDAEE